jgi:hypothetical protein
VSRGPQMGMVPQALPTIGHLGSDGVENCKLYVKLVNNFIFTVVDKYVSVSTHHPAPPPPKHRGRSPAKPKPVSKLKPEPELNPGAQKVVRRRTPISSCTILKARITACSPVATKHSSTRLGPKRMRPKAGCNPIWTRHISMDSRRP